MMKLKYILLTLSLAEFAIGFSNARASTFFYLGLPLGVIFLGLYLIVHSLEKESALYDEQNHASESVTQSAEVHKQGELAMGKMALNPVTAPGHS
jgi:hypothetical protein